MIVIRCSSSHRLKGGKLEPSPGKDFQVHLFPAPEIEANGGICVSWGKVHSFQPSPNTWLWFVWTLPSIPAENTSSGTLCVSLCMFFCRCVTAWRERASAQLSGSASDLGRPLSVPMKWKVLLPASRVFVCQWARTFHTCDHSAGSRASKLLCRT